MGTHQWNIRIKDLQNNYQLFSIVNPLYNVSIAFVKCSILFQYISIFVPSRKSEYLYWAPRALIVVNILFYIICTFILIFLYRPVAEPSPELILQHYRLRFFAAYLSTAVINAFTDLVIFALPQRAVWKLQMPTRKKVAVSGAFLLGVL
ncbi:MAG: hypothetical protein Q9183_004742 [Haloplaca sp. 2 TL-2023]